MKPIFFLNTKTVNFIAFCFILLAILAHYIPFFSFDLFITKQIQNINHPLFHNLLWLISLPGNTNYLPFTLAVILSVLLIVKHRLGIITSLISVAFSVSLSSIIKVVVHRSRPIDSLVYTFDHLTDMSFPSSHTLTYTLVLGFLIYLTQREIKNRYLKTIFTFIFALIIFLVGISRIYLGVHWFSDVLGGYLLGLVCLHFTICLYRHFKLHSI